MYFSKQEVFVHTVLTDYILSKISRSESLRSANGFPALPVLI